MSENKPPADPEEYLKYTARRYAAAVREVGQQRGRRFQSKELNQALHDLQKAALVFNRIPERSDELRGIKRLKEHVYNVNQLKLLED